MKHNDSNGFTDAQAVARLLPGSVEDWSQVARVPALGLPSHLGLDAAVTVYASAQAMAVIKRYHAGAGVDLAQAATAFAQAAEAGLAPGLISSDVRMGALALAHPGPDWRMASGLDFDTPERVEQIVAALRRFHATAPLGWSPSCPAPERAPVGVDPAQWSSLVSRMARIEDCLAAAGSDVAPCHREVYPSNVLVSETGVLLVDFDHAADEDPYCDLGALALSLCDLPADFDALVECYAGSARRDLVARTHLHAIREDFRWGCIALDRFARDTAPPIDFLGYARMRLMRCEGFLARWDLGALLADLAR